MCVDQLATTSIYQHRTSVNIYPHRHHHRYLCIRFSVLSLKGQYNKHSTMTNLFRILGDLSHVVAIITLFVKIWKTKSCAGISGKTQFLLTTIHVTRYLDLFTTYISAYNTSMKLFYIAAGFATLFLIYVVCIDTYDHNYDSFRIELLVIPTLLLSLFINYEMTPLEILWVFSIYLESVAILPQMFLILNKGEIDKTIRYYLFALVSYRTFYILNWAYRYYDEGHYDLISIVSGIIQVLFYLDVFYLYVAIGLVYTFQVILFSILISNWHSTVFYIYVTMAILIVVSSRNRYGFWNLKPVQELTKCVVKILQR